MFKKELLQEHPYGWQSYRRNLSVLYERHVAANKGSRQADIDELFANTIYPDDADFPDFVDQWNDLNAIEQRLLYLIDDAQLSEEIVRKLARADEMGLPGAAATRERFRKAEDGGHSEQKRAIAYSLLSEMYVKLSYQYGAREKRSKVSRRLIALGGIIVGIPFSILLVGSFVAPFIPVLDQFKPSRWANSELTAFFFVLFFGTVGAYFSRLARYANNMKDLTWNELDLGYSAGALYVRLLVGAIAALILFFLMMGDVLSGRVFLDGDFILWATDKGSDQPMIPLRPSENFARLVVWSIVAGFSERFVPDRLGDAAKSNKKGSGDSTTD